MRFSRTTVYVAVALAVGLLLGGTTVAVATTGTSTVKVCVTPKNVVRSAGPHNGCPSGTSKRAVSVAGPQGPAGAVGPQGPGSTDVYATNIPTTGPTPTLATVSGFELVGGCGEGFATVTIRTTSGSKVRYAALPGGDGAHPSTTIDDDADRMSFSGDTFVRVQGLITDLGSTKSLSVDLYATWLAGVCTVSGQLTP